MKLGLLLAMTLRLAACASQEQAERDRLTDRIEDQVRLPKRANPFPSEHECFGPSHLNDTARHSLDTRGTTLAVVNL